MIGETVCHLQMKNDQAGPALSKKTMALYTEPMEGEPNQNLGLHDIKEERMTRVKY